MIQFVDTINGHVDLQYKILYMYSIKNLSL